LRALLARPEVVAVGECGLDYHRDFSPRVAQRQAFAWQIQWGRECGKPLFLHQREAHDDFVAILREQARAPLHGVAHCFTGDDMELDAYLELGLHIGITGWICDERRGLHLRELVRRIPRGRLLLETDGPYLLPRDLRPAPRSRRNEPAYLPHIATTVAACRGESFEECAAHTTAAARALFGLPAAWPPAAAI
jgi:TatD DNase family protein